MSKKASTEKERQSLAFNKFKRLSDKGFSLLFHIMRDLDIKQDFTVSSIHECYKCCIEMGCNVPIKETKVDIIQLIFDHCDKDFDGFMLDLLRYNLKWQYKKNLEYKKIEWKNELLDLLAIIHSDGGHYVHDNGLDKAVTDGKDFVQYLKTIQMELYSQIRQFEPDKVQKMGYILGTKPSMIVHTLVRAISGHVKVGIDER